MAEPQQIGQMEFRYDISKKEKELKLTKNGRFYRETTLGRLLKESFTDLRKKYPDLKESIENKVWLMFELAMIERLEHANDRNITISAGCLEYYKCVNFDWSFDLRDVHVSDEYQHAVVPRLKLYCHAGRMAKLQSASGGGNHSAPPPV